MFFISIVCLAGFAETQNYIGAAVCLVVMGIETYRANQTVENSDTDWQTILLEWIFDKKKGLGNGNSNKPKNKSTKVIVPHDRKKWKSKNECNSKFKAI